MLFLTIRRIAGALLLVVLLAAACTTAIQPANVSSVTVETRDGQHVAVVQGEAPDACTEVKSSVQTVKDGTIQVGLLQTRPQDAICAQVVTPYTYEIVLDTQDLPPGAYTVDVNGQIAQVEIGPASGGESGGEQATKPAPVASIEVEQRDGSLVLIVSGDLPDPCHKVRETTARAENGAITAAVQVTPPAGDEICAQVITPYTVEIPVESDKRLEPGQYQVQVNDKVIDVTIK